MIESAYNVAMKGVRAGHFVACLPYVDEDGDVAVDIFTLTKPSRTARRDLTHASDLVRQVAHVEAAMELRKAEGYPEPPRTEEYPCA